MRYFILTLLFSFIFSECDDLNVLQCSSNADCEWIEDIDYGSCGSLGAGECNSTPGCNWECGFSHGSCYWCCWYECGGGSYEIDNSYCQENPNPPSCSEMGQSQCNNSDCEWVENIETDNCYDILDCTDGCTWQDCEAIEGCNWHFGTAYYDPSYCYGEHITDNSYCQENLNPPTCSEMSQIQCNNNSDCQWTEDIEFGHCSDFSSWQCGYVNDECWGDLCYGGSYGSWSFCCQGGSYEIDNSYCEDSDYIQGDLNGDFILNILDVLLIIDIILNQESSDLAEINGDGIVNILDIIELVDLILE